MTFDLHYSVFNISNIKEPLLLREGFFILIMVYWYARDMTYQPLPNLELIELLPDGFTPEQGLILSARNGANWLECAAIEGYSLGLRAAWRHRGEQWLDLAGIISIPSFTPTSEEHVWTLNDHLERADRFWDLTKDLGCFCRSQASE